MGGFDFTGGKLMAEIKWIKIAVNIFDNRKIKQIENMPQGDGILAIWLKILCLAGTINDCGAIYLTRDIPYTEATLATEFNRPLPLIQLALSTFQQFGMIEIVNNFICISNWEKYQSVDRMAEIREYNRLAQQKSREKRKELNVVNDLSMTSQSCHDTDIDKELEVDKEEDIEKKKLKKIADKPLSDFDIAINNFKDHRKKIKKPMTDHAVDLLKKDLQKYAPDDVQKQIELIDRAIMKGWQTVYPDKEQTSDKPKSKHFDYDENGKVIEVWR